ncbi:MAG: AI-2E family transporter [Caldisericia bacterium]|nr:AI-2E family transporter [Caldisericia bacterium]
MIEYKNLAKKVLIVIIIIFLFITFLYILYKLKTYFLLILLTTIFSYLFSIITTFLNSKKINLLISKILSILIVLIFIILILFIIVPPVISEVSKIIKNFEDIIKSFSNFIYNQIEEIKIFIEEIKFLNIDFDKLFSSFQENLSSIIINVIEKFFIFLQNTFRVLINVAFAFLISVFFIFERERVLNGLKNEIPIRYRERIVEYINELNFYLKRYILGQAFMSFIVGGSLTIFCYLINIPYAGTLGFIAGVAEIIYYIGPIFTFIIGVVISFTVSPITALWFSIFYIAQQQITANFVYPLFWSKRIVKISPIALFATMIFLLSLFGPLSLFFTVPLLIIFKVTYEFFKKTKLYNDIQNI